MAKRYISLFSGISSESVAWRDLGWQPIAFSEVDAKASQVLAYHHPDVPNLGDIRKIDWSLWANTADVVIGGSSCQSFSVAGLQKGLDDDRGNLTLEYAKAIRTIKPQWFIWENVPGVLRDRTNAFGCLLSGVLGEDSPCFPDQQQRDEWNRVNLYRILVLCYLGMVGRNFEQCLRKQWRLPQVKYPNSGMAIGKDSSVAWRILDSQYFGVPQRRRRVFLVGFRYRNAGRMDATYRQDLSTMAGLPARVLLEPKSQGWDSKKGEKTRQKAPPSTRSSSKALSYRIGAYHSNGMQSLNPNSGIYQSAIAATLQTNGNNPACYQGRDVIAFAVDSYNSNAMLSQNPNSGSREISIVNALTTNQTPESPRGGNLLCCKHKYLAFSPNDHGQDCGYISPTLRSAGHKDSHPNSGAPPAIAKCLTSRNERNDYETETFIVGSHYQVRKLTPTECERLQGYPDGWTNVPYNGKPMAKGSRYKMCGNGITSNVLRWIAHRIEDAEAEGGLLG